MTQLITTLGPKNADELGMILPHEHVFVDLRTWDQPGYAQANVADVIELMAPEIAKAQAAGVTAIVECSAVGVGRRANILRAVSEATHFPLVVPTGIYREPWVPDWAHRASEEELRDWMMGELLGEVEESGVRAGWIKLSAGDDGLTECEAKILRAAAVAGAATNACIGSHTIRGRVVRAASSLTSSRRLVTRRSASSGFIPRPSQTLTCTWRWPGEVPGSSMTGSAVRRRWTRTMFSASCACWMLAWAIV